MHLLKTSHVLLIAAASVLGAAWLTADVVETKNGARIVGKVSKIDGGSVVVDTDYAGTITIKQGEVTAINTDSPVAVRLAGGTRIDGKVSGSAGALQVVGSDGTVNTTVDKVAASWAAGGRGPQIAALDRGWAYEVSVDVAGILAATYDGATVKVKFTPAADPKGKDSPGYEVHAAILGAGIVSKVTAGENSGETLRHEFIALALGGAPLGRELPLAVPKVAGGPRHALAVWVTRRGELTPVQAAGGWLAP